MCLKVLVVKLTRGAAPVAVKLHEINRWHMQILG
jgi:hypothetical protein